MLRCAFCQSGGGQSHRILAVADSLPCSSSQCLLVPLPEATPPPFVSYDLKPALLPVLSVLPREGIRGESDESKRFHQTQDEASLKTGCHRGSHFRIRGSPLMRLWGLICPTRLMSQVSLILGILPAQTLVSGPVRWRTPAHAAGCPSQSK